MKLFAVMFFFGAAVLPACAMESCFWAQEVTLEKFGAVEAPAPGTPVRATPRDGVNYSAAEEMLIKEFGVIGINLDITETEVTVQMHNPSNQVCFERALRQAVNSFFEDYKDPQSPLSVILRNMGVPTDNSSGSDVKQAKRKLLQLMNMPGSLLLLVREDGPNQANHGERVKDNWVFYLRLNYSNQAYWAVVDRSGKNPVYNYGAN